MDKQDWDDMMMYGEKSMIILTIFAGCFLVFGIIVFYDATRSMESEKTIIVEGEITDYKIFEDYFVLEFDNETRYKISYGDGWGDNIYDFTVNSKMIIRLNRNTYDGILFKADKEWNINSIVKVPDKNPTIR